MNVFALCSGRTASTTFARAASHIPGYTAQHESRSTMIGAERLAYPENHIEADNRLCWFLGGLDAKYGDAARYVVLERENELVALSYFKRWSLTVSVVRAFAVGVLMRPSLTQDERMAVCRHFVDTIDENLTHFLRDKTQVFRFKIDDGEAEFRRFCEWMGVKCPESGAAEWRKRHNMNQSALSSKRLKRIFPKIKRALLGIPTYLRDV